MGWNSCGIQGFWNTTQSYFLFRGFYGIFWLDFFVLMFRCYVACRPLRREGVNWRGCHHVRFLCFAHDQAGEAAGHNLLLAHGHHSCIEGAFLFLSLLVYKRPNCVYVGVIAFRVWCGIGTICVNLQNNCHWSLSNLCCQIYVMVFTNGVSLGIYARV